MFAINNLIVLRYSFIDSFGSNSYIVGPYKIIRLSNDARFIHNLFVKW